MSGPPSIREIAELTARLRALSAAGVHADAVERAAFLADKDALIARITADRITADRGRVEQGAADQVPYCAEPVSVAMPPQWLDDAERRRTEPVRPDNPEELAARLAELRGRVSDAAAAALDSAEQQRRAQLALWHTDDHGADDHGADDHITDDHTARPDAGDVAGWSR